MSFSRLLIGLGGLALVIALAITSDFFASDAASSLKYRHVSFSANTTKAPALLESQPKASAGSNFVRESSVEPNSPPVAVDDSYSLHGSLNVPGNGIIANDWDPDGNSIHLQSCTQSAHGTTTCTPTYNSFTYFPNQGYAGSDSFTYQVCDSLGACAMGTVNLTVINSPPIAVADAYIVYPYYGNLNLPGPNALRDNDSDPDGDPRSIQSLTQAQHGTVTYSWTYGSLTYAPQDGYSGNDGFTYQLCDNLGMCSNATVYLLVISGPAIGGKVPYAPCPTDPSCNAAFSPGSGGLSRATGGMTGGHGPSAPDPVDLATGRESYMPEPDLSVYNPSGPNVVWRRSYASDRALSRYPGYESPGFTRGWIHNYDLMVQGTSGSWSALKLIYPNGAIQTLTPQLNNGVPTGVLTTVAGAPYIAGGVAGSPAGTWQSITVTWKDQTKWKFTLLSGTTYALNEIANRSGQSLNFSWNTSRALTQVTDAGSGTVLLTLAYGANGRLASATDSYGRQIQYTFSTGTSTSPSMLQSVSQVVAAGTSNPPARSSFTYTADNGQQLNTVTVPSPTGSGNSTATINYNSLGKVTSLVDANGNQRVYTYNTNTTQVQVKDSANNVALSWTQKFSTGGLNTGFTDATNHSTTMVYNDAANPLRATSKTDRNGHVTTYTYDQFGNLRTITNPRNVTTTYTWNYTNFAPGRLASVQEGTKPATTIVYYEPSGLVQSITCPAPNGSGTTTTNYTYDSLGNLLTAVGPGNNAAATITTTFSYTTDGDFSQTAKVGQPITVTHNLGHVTHLRYDAQGRVNSVTDALGNETDFTYNLIGQPDTTTVAATGQTGSGRSHSTNAYLYVGGPLTTTTFYDESNVQVRQVTRAYGLEGESLSVAGSTEPVTNTYDALYRLKTLKDGNNNTTTYVYNNIGLLSSITMPGSEVTQFPSYDNDGNLLQRIDGNSVVTNYLYADAESQLTDIQYPASTSLNVHLAYDSFGRRSSMTDGTGSQSYTYGNLDETLTVITTYNGLSAKTISYQYYPNGSRQAMTTPAGTFSYSYDAAGRPASLTNPFSETTNWAYQNNDWLQTQTLANGATATYTYNSLGQVTRLLNQISGNTISDFSSITHDGAGNRTSITASIPGATSLNGTTVYSYDSKDQITQETSTRNGGFTDNFGYDSAGNPTSFKGVTKSYNSNNQQSATGFVYDGNGNSATYGGVTLTFDPENRMTAYGSVLTAGYNGDGLRAWKQNASGRTYFLYDGIVPVVELDSAASVTATNTFGAAGLISRRVGTASTFYSFDSEGNVAQRSDSSGSVLSNYLFAAHGAILSGSLSEQFGYKAQFGYYTDNETGLQLLTNRYYDPHSGRFLVQDPISYNGGINLYAYVANNPANIIDPLGLDGWGNDVADWLDNKIEAGRQYLESDLDAVNFNTAVNYGANTYHGFADLFRTGSGVGNALFNPCAADPLGDVLQDVGRAASITLMLAGPAAEIAGVGASLPAAEGELPGLPSSAPKPLGLGSTGRTAPADLGEQLAMEEAMSNPAAGRMVPLGMTDPRWPAGAGWFKMSQNINGREIHYVRNSITGAVDDFKFIR